MKDVVYTFSLYINERLRPAAQETGNIPFINEVGQIGWATSEEALRAKADAMKKYFTMTDTVRHCWDGEENVMKALFQLAGISQGAGTLDVNKLFKENYSEIVADIKAFNSNPTYTGFKPLFGVKTVEKDGKVYKYQKIYTNGFNPYKIQNGLQYKDWNCEYGGAVVVNLLEYNPTKVEDDIEAPF